MKDFSLYVFRGLKKDFKDLVISLFTKAEPISYIDLYNHLLMHEFFYKGYFQPVMIAPLLLTLTQPPLAFFFFLQCQLGSHGRGYF